MDDRRNGSTILACGRHRTPPCGVAVAEVSSTSYCQPRRTATASASTVAPDPARWLEKHLGLPLSRFRLLFSRVAGGLDVRGAAAAFSGVAAAVVTSFRRSDLDGRHRSVGSELGLGGSAAGSASWSCVAGGRPAWAFAVPVVATRQWALGE